MPPPRRAGDRSTGRPADPASRRAPSPPGADASRAARTRSAAVGLEPLLAAKEVVVFCGSGGVGKTTVAAATALGAARQLGGRVLVLTVDPAQRLADALGLGGGLGNVERRIEPEVLRAAGVEIRGELWAAMLDTKQSWDALVLRHSPDEATAYRILDNPLYRNITARFVQSHDYIAMERLHELHTDGRFDLIVVDTPPTRNAIDFLDAPQRMAEFFGGRLLRWLTMPYRIGGRRGARFVNAASRPFYQVADRILGSQFLEDIAEFFVNFQAMYDGFVERAHAVERLLHDRRTTFAVVSTLESAPLQEAEFFLAALAERSLPIGALVLNKTLSPSLVEPAGEEAARRFVDDAPGIAEALAATGETPFAEIDRSVRVLASLAESYRNFSVIAKRETELRSELVGAPELVLTVAQTEADVHDLRGLVRIADALF
jgi:anion-transporting  ArsA/GET3 family ATPase